jgi:hypothetical protein
MKNVLAEKYLGDMISSNGLAASVEATVVKRKGQVFSNILEIVRLGWRFHLKQLNN